MNDHEWLQVICRYKVSQIWPTSKKRSKQWILGHIGRRLGPSTSTKQLVLLNELLDYKMAGKKCPYHAAKKTRRDMLLPSNWPFISRNFKEKSNHICVACLKKFPTEELTTDHIMPVFEGGLSTADNLQIMCRPCHFKKTSDNRESQRAYRKFLDERLHDDLVNIRKAVVDNRGIQV